MTTSKTKNPASDSTSSAKPIENGLSYNSAVIIREKTETKGVDAEYAWIKKNYSDYQVVEQSLTLQGKKHFDIIVIEFSDKRKLDLYFDITHFFGKF